MNKPPVRPATPSPLRNKSAIAPGGARPGGSLGPSPTGSLPRVAKPTQEMTAAPTTRPPWYKRKYLVYPQFQMTLIIVNSGMTIILFGLTALLVVRSHIYLEALVRQTRLPAQNLFSQLLTQQLRTLLIYMSVALLVAVLSTGLTTLLLSHKMAGPMIKMRNFFNTISKNGDFPQDLYFRKGDFFQDLPPSVNKAFTALKKKWHR
jgi:hypothetical protein